LGLFWIFHWFGHQFVPKSCVQGICVATEKKRGWKNKRRKTEEVSATQKNLLLKKKVLAVETKERKERTKDKKRERKKVSISAAVLSLFVCFVWLHLCLGLRL
jgi:hypothetical protein